MENFVCIKEDVEQNKRAPYIDEEEGAQSLYKIEYFVSDCHNLSEKEDQELNNEERRYQYHTKRDLILSDNRRFQYMHEWI